MDTSRITYRNPLLILSWTICLATVMLILTGVTIPTWAQLVPFGVSLVFLGLPHGAVDHLIPFRLSRKRLTVGRLVLFIAGYAGLAVAYLLLWAVAPLASALLFIGLTWFHWGQGDLHAVLALHGAQHVRGVAVRALALLIRGGLPMLVPLLAFPALYLSVLDSFVQVFRPNATPYATLTMPVALRLAVAAAYLLLIAVYAGATRRAAQTPPAVQAWRRDLLEIALLSLFFAVVPPILAIGLYFCFWHALRHIGRIILLDSRARYAGALSWRAGFRHFLWDSAPLTAVSLAFLVVVYALTTRLNGYSADMLALYMVLISALTLPHTAVVLWMDQREGIWSTDSGERHTRRAPAMRTSPAQR